MAHWIGLLLHRAELVARPTPREQEIDSLVALGRSNAEIAERLVITEGTVANHVRRILQKLDVPNRARVAALMAQIEVPEPSPDGSEVAQGERTLNPARH